MTHKANSGHGGARLPVAKGSRIASRRRAQAGEKERFAQSTLDALLSHIAILDERGIIIAVNRAWRGFAEVNHATPAGVCEGAHYLAVCDAVRGDDTAQAARFAGAVRAIMRGEQDAFTLEYPCHSPEQQRWFSVRVTRFFFEGAVRIVVAHENITDRKHAEEAFKASEEKMRASEAAARARGDELAAVLAATPAITFIAHDPDCLHMTSSGAALRLLRLAADANTSKSAPLGERPETFRAMKHGRELRSEELPVQLAAATGQAVKNFELTLAFGDGTTREIVGDAVPLFNAKGKVRGAVGAFLDITERKRTEEELSRSREALRALAARMERVREEERTRISREIHDELGHAFTDFRLDLGWLTRRLADAGISGHTAIRKRISAMSRRAETNAQTVRRIATELRPAVLDTLGLAATIEWQAREWQKRTRILCDVEIPGDLPVLSAEQATGLFRVFQEILSNVAQHARADRVHIKMEAPAGRFALQVRDNGRGITQAEQSSPTALGLLGMGERIRILGGTLTIQGAPGAGTMVTVSIPLTAP